MKGGKNFTRARNESSLSRKEKGMQRKQNTDKMKGIKRDGYKGKVSSRNLRERSHGIKKRMSIRG